MPGRQDVSFMNSYSLGCGKMRLTTELDWQVQPLEIEVAAAAVPSHGVHQHLQPGFSGAGCWQAHVPGVASVQDVHQAAIHIHL